MDVYVAKISPSGSLIWSTFIGGPNYDRAYAIELDPSGNVVVGGRAGRNFPVTGGAFQTTFQGHNTGALYGEQNAFVCKLAPNGASLRWCSYEGPFDMNRDIAVDSAGNVYGVSNYNPADGGGPINTSWFAGAYQPVTRGDNDGVVIKIKADGTQVLWATFLGGSGYDSGTPSIRVDGSGNPYVLLYTNSADIPTTVGAYDRTYNGGGDLYLAKLSSTGSSLTFGTYFGGSSSEFSETHGLALDPAGNAYIAATTRSTDMPTTLSAFDRSYNGSGGSGTNYPGDAFIAKISSTGASLIASTYLGGSDGEGLEGVAIDGSGNVYVAGASFSTNLPTTGNAFQTLNSGQSDFFVAKLSGDLRQLLFSSFAGGSATDYGRSVYTDGMGNFYLVGMSNSIDFPLLSPLQTLLRGAEDGILVKFSSN